MDKIKSFYIYNLRNNEHFEFMTRIVTLVDNFGASALKIEAQLAALKAALVTEDDLLNRISQSLLTKEINEADAARDEIYYGLLKVVRGNEAHFNNDVRKAAERVLHLIENYGAGKVAHMTVDEESSIVYNICKDLIEKYAEDVVTLAILQWIQELKRRNKVVQDLLVNRIEQNDPNRTKLMMKDVRAEVDAAYGLLSDAVFAQGFVASLGTDAELTEKYSTMIGRWNDAIDRTENILAARRGRAKAKKEEEAEGETPAPEV